MNTSVLFVLAGCGFLLPVFGPAAAAEAPALSDLDLAGQTKLHEFGADFAESRTLDRCRRRQATVLAFCRGAHHHELCVSLALMIQPFLLSWRSERSGPLTRTSPGSATADGAVGSRALAASDDDTNASFRTQNQSFLRRTRTNSEWPARDALRGPYRGRIRGNGNVMRVNRERACAGMSAVSAFETSRGFHVGRISGSS
jgi:hypothetical protein